MVLQPGQIPQAEPKPYLATLLEELNATIFPKNCTGSFTPINNANMSKQFYFRIPKDDKS